MLYVLTVHHKRDDWIPIQLDHLRRHLTEPFRVHACLEEIDLRWHSEFDRVLPAQGPHAGKLNLLAWDVVNDAADTDLLMFLDGDAFPIADPMPSVRASLGIHDLTAVQRLENNGDPQPHPCFCVTTVVFWRDLRGDWAQGATWTDPSGEEVSDVGGNLQWMLERAGASWEPIHRSNAHNPHPVWFGIYGDIVYHHGSGFWKGLSRAVRSQSPWLRLPRWVPSRVARRGHNRWVSRKKDALSEISRQVHEQARHDPEFYKQFL